MQQVGKLAQTVVRNGARQFGQTSTKLPPKTVEAIFAKFSVLFGNSACADRYGPPSSLKYVYAEWAEALADMSAEQIAKALRVTRATRNWPPTIAEFRESAFASEDPVTNAAHRLYLPEPDRSTPEQRLNSRVVALRQLGKCREILSR